ncbi:response regulator [Marinifilum sp. D737]|uniref:response regulator n=1 Tax=Marinifilum sp. D737 TaxID=2969628 RepID=UPI002272FB8B|nr:response regulator [Marinifilum sp. D737]MCY1635099.1 response regulator [Marinifilum sp. D737]
MNIVVIEDHHLLKKASADLLAEMYPEAHIESFTYPSKATAYIQNHEIHLMMVDYEYTDRKNEDIISFVAELKRKRKNIKCIAYTNYKLNVILKDLLKAKFNSYLNKDAKIKDIVSTIDAVMNQDSDTFYESPSYLEHKRKVVVENKRFYISDKEKEDSLTKTELKVTKTTSENSKDSNEQLASKLGITLNTLKKHLSNIYRKLDIKSKEGLKHFYDRVKENY